MTRLEVTYHDNQEPIGVTTYQCGGQWIESGGVLRGDGTVYHHGPDGQACADLLRRERQHWLFNRVYNKLKPDLDLLAKDD